MPLGGFANLVGATGLTKFTISSVAYSPNKLPTASTWLAGPRIIIVKPDRRNKGHHSIRTLGHLIPLIIKDTFNVPCKMYLIQRFYEMVDFPTECACQI